MRKHLYPHLAWLNLKHNYQFYIPYLLTIVGTAAVFYIMTALSYAGDLPQQIRYAYLTMFMTIGCFVVALFTVIFLFYTNSFLMKRRQKELGLYNVLGMGKGHIARVLAWETVYIGLAGIVGGILCGMLFQRLVTLIVYRVVRYSVGFTFYICWKGIAMTAILFGAVLLVNLVYNLIRIHLQNPVAMMREGSAGEKEPKSKWILAILGVLCLGGGYGIALRAQDALEALALYFVAVFLVIIGTYCLFTAGSIAILKLLRKNKKYYYKTNHFISVSGMLYRMKRNGVGLANICILCTMVLVMISGTVSLFLGTEDIVNKVAPADWTSILRYNPADGDTPDFAALEQRIAETARSQGLEVEKNRSFTSMERSFYLQDGQLKLNPQEDPNGSLFWDAEVDCLFLPAADYTVLTGIPLFLSPGEIAVHDPDGLIPNQSVLVFNVLHSLETGGTDGGTWDYTVVQKLAELPVTGGWSPMIGAANVDENHGCCVVVDSLDTLLELHSRIYGAFGNVNGYGYLQWSLLTELSGSEQEKLDAYCNTFDSFETTPDFSNTGSWEWFSTESQQVTLEEYYSMNGGFLFLGVFLGILFLAAAVLIIYYKQISEGYEDRQRFQIMQKVGLERQQIKKSINGQILVVFFLPLLAAAVHVAFDFRLMVLLLQLFAMDSVKLTALCTLVTFGPFAALYILVYRITARAYYKIVT